MTKVITYGTYDMLHYGHIRLLERAKALGDYLIVGITSDDYDKTRGKINLQQTLTERIEAVRDTGIADLLIVEEYEGQKIDDIIKYNVDIFTVGSDWEGYFDYLKEFCEVVYLERTQGISSSELRSEKTAVEIGLVGSADYLEKVLNETPYVNGLSVKGIYTDMPDKLTEGLKRLSVCTSKYDMLLDIVGAVYIHSYPAVHYYQVKRALLAGKHVLCESPVALNADQCKELFLIAQEKKLVLMEAIRTAYSTAYQRMLLLLKAGKIGDIVSVDVTCTSFKSVKASKDFDFELKWNSIVTWGPTALLPIFQILGTKYRTKQIISRLEKMEKGLYFDSFTKVDMIYDHATASIKVGRGVKSEGDLVVSGTKGYIYIPAPWWKTDYFEIRYENPSDNKRYFYQLDGEGIRYELVAFLKAIANYKIPIAINKETTMAISEMMEDFVNHKDMLVI